jgi:hypothetical protein
VDGETYASPTYGYGVSWDPAWSVVTSSSENGLDWLGIANGTSSIDVAGATQFADPAGCLQLVTGNYEQNEAITDFAPAAGGDGQPYAEAGADRAAGAFTFVSDGVSMVSYVQCRVLEPGVSGMLIAVETPQASYEQDRAAIDGVLASLQGPDGAPMGIALPDLLLPGAAAEAQPAASPVASPIATPVAAASYRDAA